MFYEGNGGQDRRLEVFLNNAVSSGWKRSRHGLSDREVCG